jgi:hypothetical protein
MRWLKRKDNNGQEGGTAVAERPPETTERFTGTTEELQAEIERLAAANRAGRDLSTERRLLRLRHLLGERMLDAAAPGATYPEPAADRLPQADDLPEFRREELTPELLRAGILRDGCLLVRGLVSREQALQFAERIDRLFAERERHDAGQASAPGYYEEFHPEPRFEDVVARPWIKDGGGVLAADSPILSFEMLELFRSADVSGLVDGYLGEPGLISVHKTTLRKAAPSVPGAWHQDGSFMGQVRSLNLWLSLSRCGDVAPGLDLVPRRLDEIVTTQTDEAMLEIQVSQRMAEEAAGDKAIIRPVFEPGDALFFDELFLHSTASDPSMPNPRFAIENWFFGASSFPADYAPVATT